MLKVLTVMGTRPEAVKMAPIVSRLAQTPGIESRLLVTAQHREMLDQVLDVFELTPDYDLDVMRANQTLGDVMAHILVRIQPVLREFRPNWVLVQGDTTTVLAAATAAAFENIRVGHVEAGLRTYDRQNPFPEEMNRVLVDHISDLCFAPTETAAAALRREGIAEEKIHITGNPVIDAIRRISARSDHPLPVTIPEGKRLIVVTAHRRENHGRPLRQIIEALRQLALRPDVHIVYPVHYNPNVLQPVTEALGNTPGISLTEPLDYLTFVHLMKRADIILTDSGGLQEEAPSLGVPILVMRELTERPEAIEAGVARLVGTDTATIVAEAARLLDDETAYNAMAHAVNPFGDGSAALQIVDLLLRHTLVPAF
ncbi:MAG: UDP-N-acetylglucosamine 2-epimerase (non-hydrolyzing) [Anaerolineae bacterium]|nr:UDP-N-acetylglucosamine 2-epimerase (non-hydrolyzing) [Anaerolineae bacterium]MCO5203647.1 UDP-N-acetylglucosamine 2-epimerase (non-hydrolyzing) [Anaerolineae bacterium]